MKKIIGIIGLSLAGITLSIGPAMAQPAPDNPDSGGEATIDPEAQKTLNLINAFAEALTTALTGFGAAILGPLGVSCAAKAFKRIALGSI